MTLERKVLVQALTGSHNYNLQTEGSDKDYKIFTAPTFEDMFKNYNYKRNIITDTVDKDVKDIRQLPELLWKSNIAYLELLFSKELELADDDNLRKLFNLKDEIVKMNLPQLFKSTGGMFNQRMARLDKGTDGTQHLVDKYGYNTKEAMHAYRSLHALIRYERQGFRDFGKALWYEDHLRDVLLAIKYGGLTKDYFEEFVMTLHDKAFVPLKEKYCSQKTNLELKEYIDSLVMDVVQDEIFHELYAKSH